MRKVFEYCAAVFFICAVAAVFWWYRPLHLNGNGAVPASDDSAFSDAATTAVQQAPLGPHREAPSSAREYYDEVYRFSLFYPKDLEVRKIDEGSGASTIIFQNPQEGKGFQIFIVPYYEREVSEEQFKKDVPSGVRKNISEVVVDGAIGAAFHSSNISLGETREVWFIKNGFLYEATVPRALEAWFLGILQTWKFL